jgi:hypothetical protein
LQPLTVSEAAKQLGVSQQAIHGRIKRGTIEHKIGEDGRILVTLPEGQTRAQRTDNTPVEGVVNDYIEALKSQIGTLESHIQSLEHDREEWKEEARRKDTIIMALTNRIPELEAAQDTPPEATESPLTASGDSDRGDVPQEVQTRPWWRRIFQ